MVVLEYNILVWLLGKGLFWKALLGVTFKGNFPNDVIKMALNMNWRLTCVKCGAMRCGCTTT